MTLPSALYFGCWQQPGHFFWVPNEHGGLTRHGGFSETFRQLPWGSKLDGGLTPTRPVRQGTALLHQKDGWTALAVNDYTVDHRSGSNSVFVLHGTVDFDLALDLAHRKFAPVVARIGTIELVG